MQKSANLMFAKQGVSVHTWAMYAVHRTLARVCTWPLCSIYFKAYSNNSIVQICCISYIVRTRMDCFLHCFLLSLSIQLL